MSTRHVRSRAEALIDSLGIKDLPIKVKDIAEKHLNIPVFEIELGKGVSGILVANSKGSCIAVNKIDPSTRKRFSIAHEIAHYYLGHQFNSGEQVHVDHGNRVSLRSPRSSTGLDAKEIEANQFAASLLMPFKLLRKAIDDLKVSQLTDAHVTDLAKKFDVSEQAMTIRLSALNFI